MCGGIHYGEVEGWVSVARPPWSRGVSCMVEYTMGRLRDWSVERWSCSRGASCVVEYNIGRLRDWSL